MGANDISVQYVKGVGPKRAALLAKLGIATVSDMLHYYPRDWQDRRTESLLSLFRQDNFTILCGSVMYTRFIPTHSGLGIFQAVLVDEKGSEAEAVWFKRTAGFSYDPFTTLKNQLTPGRKIWIIGRPNGTSAGMPKIQVDEYYAADDAQAAAMHFNRLTPVYSLTQGLNGKFMRETAYRTLKNYAKLEEEAIPPALISKRQLLEISQALKGIHFPDSMAELESARRRLVYEEFLLLTTAWSIKRRQSRVLVKNYSYEIKKTLLAPFRAQLGFEFTSEQKKVINEIFADMTSPRPMTRLLQGDVGSGKTVVALCAFLLAVENGCQCAFMAPTEILAEQHFITFKKFLKDLPVRFEVLTSKVKSSPKKDILERAAKGEIDILIGTHAIIEENVKFANLRIAVIDEQHRFGVRQRALLKRKTDSLDLMIMTATPIPRTLAMAFYGDLDVSIIDSLPPGRKPITTRACSEDEAFKAVRAEIAKGRQAYIVHPLIEESSLLEAKSVKAEFERLSKTVFPDLRLAMMHGQMNGKQKVKVMEDFLKGNIDILVATPVIEVGIDVKNATVMLVQNADRFGLASLHQLRGRIGRGEDESFCFLVSDSNSPEALDRINIVCSTQDGFKIGEKDMQMRGPGEILGTRQHGEMELKAGDLIKDRQALDWVLEDRNELLNNDANLLKPENQPFRRRLLELYSKKWQLIDIS